MISGGGNWGPYGSVLIETLLLFYDFALVCCEVYERKVEYNAFAGK